MAGRTIEMIERYYARPDRDIRYPRGYKGERIMQLSCQLIDPATMTARVFGGTVTAEVLDRYLYAVGGWTRIVAPDDESGPVDDMLGEK